MVKIEIASSEKYKNNKQSAFVSFNYNADIVSILRTMPKRFYHAEDKKWEVDIDSFDILKSRLKDYQLNIIGEEPIKEEIELPENFEFKTKPYQHQIDGVKYGLNKSKYLLADEMGLGKTKQIIDLAVLRKQQDGIKHCLIICGVNGVKFNWQKEIETHSNESGWILGLKPTNNGNYDVGGNKEKLEQLCKLQGKLGYSRPIIKDCFFLITNIESLRNKDICNKLKELCDNNVIGMIAIDEFHRCSNPVAQQTKGILTLQTKYQVAMTGTPILNNPLDLFAMLKWLGYESHNFYQFKNHFCVMGGYGNYQITGYKNLDELKTQTENIMLRRKKEEVLDLPEKIYIDEYVDMNDAQQMIYKEVRSEILANIDKIKLNPNPLTALMRLRQATGHTKILSSTIRESAKMNRMVELVDDIVKNDKKVIIYSNWTKITDIIMKELKNYNPALITGQLDTFERQQQVDKFQNDDKCRVLVGTIGACGTGITLTAATNIIFVDEPWNQATKEQAIDRAHRIGQQSNLTIFTLLTRDTIDCRIHELVYKKGLIADVMIDNEYAKISPDMLDFLLN